MLTLKYVDPEGLECLSQHEQVDTDRHESDKRLRVFGRKFGAERADYDRMYIAPTGYNAAEVNAPQPYGRHTVFVMNQHGSTVARYAL